MSHDEILQGVASVARAHVGVEATLAPETHLLRDLRLDSLARLTLVAELENHFRICFDESDEQGVETVDDLVRLIARRLEEESTHG
jgi:acyl carrier protein